MNRIQELRELKGVLQKELAGEIGVKQPTVSDWESGRKVPSAKNTMKLSKYFGVTVEYLMGEPAPIGDDKDEVWQLREQLRRDPERRTLFDAASNVRKEDILTAVRILDALKGGDDSDGI